jgi:hypothetical protein
MKENLESARRTLESRLKEAAPSRGLRDSIRIHQAADPLDMTQQAAERERFTISIGIRHSCGSFVRRSSVLTMDRTVSVCNARKTSPQIT